jgi:hypothetical protein
MEPVMLATRTTTNPFPTQNPRPLALQLGIDAAEPLAPVAADRFARVDSATALGAADSGHPWNVNSGTWGIAGRQAYCPSPGTADQSFAWLESGLTNCSVRATIAALPSLAAYLVFRFVPPSSYLVLYVTPTLYQVQRASGGTLTPVATLLVTPAAGDRLRVQGVDRVVRVYVNDVQQAAISSSTGLGGTKHGLGANDASARWAAYVVTPE